MSALQAAGGDRGWRIDAEAAAGGHLVPVATNALDGDVARALVAQGSSDPNDYSQSTYVAVEDGSRPDGPEAQGFHEYPDGKFGLEDWAPPPIVNTSAKILDGRPMGHVEAHGGDDIAPTVTSKWAKGSGGPAGSETPNLVATSLIEGAHGVTGDDVAGAVQGGGGKPGQGYQAVVVHGLDTYNQADTGDEAGTLRVGSNGAGAHAQVVVVGDGGTDVSHPVTASGTDGMGRGVPAVAYGIAGEDVAHALTAEGHDASEDGTGRGTPIVAVGVDVLNQDVTGDLAHTVRGGHDQGVPRVIHSPDVAAPLTAGSHAPGVSAPGRRQEDDHNLVAFRKAKRAQTDTDDETWQEAEYANTLNTFDGGDARATEVIVDPDPPAVHDFYGNDYSSSTDGTPPLRAAAAKGVAPVLQTHAAVRRLTPTECERLQSFPDGWTLVPDAKGKPAADSPRYKQLGNSVCCNVAEWIACRILDYDDGVLG